MAPLHQYPVGQSALDLRSDRLRENREKWVPVLDKFEKALNDVSSEGTEASLSRHQSRGQLLPRDRIALLLDQGSPFLELCSFAGYGNRDSTPCANLIAGIGTVSGTICLLMSHIPTRSGGAWNEMTVIKVNRMLEIATENDLPLISLVQSAGVFLPQQFRVFHKGGQLFRDLAVRTMQGKSSCAIVFGSSTAGGAYHPALSDYTIFVENQAQAFLGGPPLVKMATGEIIEAEELGGARIHAAQTGLADQIAIDEFDAIHKARDWVASLKPRLYRVLHEANQARIPRYPVEDLLYLVNPDIRKAFDMREVILRIVDDSRISTFKPQYGPNMLTAWAHIMGHRVGIVANQVSIINPHEAAKAAQCSPIVFLHNVTGFMVGAKSEHAGIIKIGAQLVSAVSCSQVPHISIIMGASYGAGNYAMCGRAYKPRFIFTWPIGKCSVMGPDQLAGVMEQIQMAKTEGTNSSVSEENLKKATNDFRIQAQKDAESYATSSMIIDDGIIDPRDTRDVLGMCLDIVSDKEIADRLVERTLHFWTDALSASPRRRDAKPTIGPQLTQILAIGGTGPDRATGCLTIAARKAALSTSYTTRIPSTMPSTEIEDPTLSAMPAREALFVAPLPVNPVTGLPFIQKLFIANRGEIACRIIATCQKLMVRTVVAYVLEDQQSQHVDEADEIICLGSMGDHAGNPFLDIDLLVKTALDAAADAIHPGYGYLSENAGFADRVRQAGLIFIGPSSSAMSTLGDKRRSKEYLSEKAPHVPLIPGFKGSSLDLEDLLTSATNIGFPVMLKASAGGGGKGMRVVREASQLSGELARVQSEAERSFGSTDCILEKFIEKSKHVEIQIMGDSHGNVISFFERDCSAQRRHQKVIEETPCEFLTDELRQAMSQTALTIASLIGYDNAGTVEFVVDVETCKFFFLEVNARLQVEHPITEEVTGTDLVALQLYVAAGGNLKELSNLQQVKQTGHAMECRLCAEDPSRDFFPEHGTVQLWRPYDSIASSNGYVRHETALRSGSSISIYFDSMVAKVVVWAPTRTEAIQRMILALKNLACVGIKTNQLFLQRCLEHPYFHDLRYTTSFIPQNLDQLLRIRRPKKARFAEIIISALCFRFTSRMERINSGSRIPFGNVRTHFRTQRYDPVSVNADVIVPSHAENPLLCLWKSDVPNSAFQDGEVKIIELLEASKASTPDDADQSSWSSPAKATVNQYNKISNMLRNERHDLQPLVRFKLHRFEAIARLTSAFNNFPCQSAKIEISLDETKFLAYCVVPDNRSDKLEQPQEILCHFPHVGEWLGFQRHTLLSYSESRRELVKAENKNKSNEIVAPMPCKVLSIQKKNGDHVESGDEVMVIESMKMEVSVKATRAGLFETTWVERDSVSEGQALCRVL
ncbi:hypothetical protein JX265_004855 [Neoarthrinium moseri]|uniref:acetyl-CoA carboxylase n=1 Tax=Neoarthrinium moseri TaxID=1658444 RepID=A0A9Q0AQW7_9PEZI|nr:hypothetical protein JX266_007106 [Neoarthrinium moseri]KAI1874647.1 hypothetical protein JX265_004855 [Neoarthrinium moseri]